MKAIILTSLLALSATAGGATKPTVQKIAKQASGFTTNSHETQPSGTYLGATSSALGCLDGGADPDETQKGIVVGCTFHDSQKYGSMGRQIATDHVFHAINFAFVNNSSDRSPYDDARFEGFFGGALGDGTGGVSIIGPCSSCLEDHDQVTLAGLNDGTTLAAIGWNRIYQTDPTAYKPYVFKNETPGLPDFGGFGGVALTGKIPDSAWDSHLVGNANIFARPQIAYTDFGATQVAHLVISSDRTDGDNTALYLRRVGSADWETVMELGPAGFHRSFVVTNSRTSERVGIAFSGGRGDGTSGGAPISRYDGTESGQNDNDIYLILSDDAGATWGPLQNITQRPDSAAGGFVPHAKLSALFGPGDDFHVVWQARQWTGYDAQLNTLSRMYHWDDNSQYVRIAADGVWNPTDCLPGFQQLNTDNPQLSECEGKLYLTFNMFAPVPYGRGDDCAARAYAGYPLGAANADIYVAVSDNNGFNWDPPRNLTQTYTPNCDTFPDASLPDCGNEVWHSTTRYGIDVTLENFVAIADFSSRLDGAFTPDAGEYLFIQYVDDSDPGAAPLGEGGWHDNPLRSFRFGCVDIVNGGGVIGSSIAEGQAVDDPTYTLPGTSETVDWIISNIGNSQLLYAVSIDNQSPPGNITVTGDDGGLDPGAINWDSLVITLNANLEATEQHAHAEITLTGNFINGNPAGTMHFNIDYTIGELQEKVQDSIAGCLIYDNRGNIGDQATKRLSFDVQGGPSECDTTALSYLFEGSPIVSYPGDGGNIVVSSMFNSGFVDSFTFRPQTEPEAGVSVVAPGVDSGWIRGNSGEFTTQDSSLGFIVDYWAPGAGQSELSDDWKVIFGRVCMTNRTTNLIPGAYLAYGWDWDVPSVVQAQNLSQFPVGTSLMYQQGSQDTTANCIDNDRRFAAVRYFNPDEIDDVDAFVTGAGCGAAGFQAMYTRDNATFVGAEWDHKALDSLLQNISGFDDYTTVDPELLDGTDIHMVLNSGSYDIDQNDTVYLYFAMIAGIAFDNTEDNLIELDDVLQSWSPWATGTCCDVPGDANNDGAVTIADVLFIITRIFNGGPNGDCCEKVDADGSGGVSIGDVTRLIDYIFSGGSSPVCGPAGMICGAE